MQTWREDVGVNGEAASQVWQEEHSLWRGGLLAGTHQQHATDRYDEMVAVATQHRTMTVVADEHGRVVEGDEKKLRALSRWEEEEEDLRQWATTMKRSRDASLSPSSSPRRMPSPRPIVLSHYSVPNSQAPPSLSPPQLSVTPVDHKALSQDDAQAQDALNHPSPSSEIIEPHLSPKSALLVPPETKLANAFFSLMEEASALPSSTATEDQNPGSAISDLKEDSLMPSLPQVIPLPLPQVIPLPLPQVIPLRLHIWL